MPVHLTGVLNISLNLVSDTEVMPVRKVLYSSTQTQAPLTYAFTLSEVTHEAESLLDWTSIPATVFILWVSLVHSYILFVATHQDLVLSIIP